MSSGRDATTGSTNLRRAAKLCALGTAVGLTDEVVDASKKCLLDWLGVALGARDEAAGIAVRATLAGWGATGNAVQLFGPRTAPALAALANGTLAHCLDFDDTHAASVAHLSGPVWAAVLASAAHPAAGMPSGADLLHGFAIGYEVGAGFGGRSFGIEVDHAGWHSTGVFGALAATAGASAVMRLDVDAAAHALGAAATQVGGLTGSFGTMAKPFHAGKAAFHGVLSAELAAHGFAASQTLLEPDGGLAHALLPQVPPMSPAAFSQDCTQVLHNTFKPYACCLLTHASVDAARYLSARIAGRRLARITARVSPLAMRLASIAAPRTPLEGKFSTAFCIALGLLGHAATREDFTEARLADATLGDLVARVTLVEDPSMKETAAHLRIDLQDGSILERDVALARGNPENPLRWDDLRAKFDALVGPVLDRSTANAVVDVVRTFERPDSLERLWALVDSR